MNLISVAPEMVLIHGPLCLVPDRSELAPHHSRYRLTTTALINGPFIVAFIGPLFPRQLRYPPDTLVPPRGGVAQDSRTHQPFDDHDPDCDEDDDIMICRG